MFSSNPHNDKPVAKRKKKKKTPWQLQISRLDGIFSEFVRLTAMDPLTRMCKCVTCGKPKLWNKRKSHAGHFINQFDNKNLRVRQILENTGVQCYVCNIYQSGNKWEFAKYIDATWGAGTVKWLEVQATKSFNPDIFKIEDKIKFYRAKVKQLKFDKVAAARRKENANK